MAWPIEEGQEELELPRMEPAGTVLFVRYFHALPKYHGNIPKIMDEFEEDLARFFPQIEKIVSPTEKKEEGLGSKPSSKEEAPVEEEVESNG